MSFVRLEIRTDFDFNFNAQCFLKNLSHILQYAENI